MIVYYVFKASVLYIISSRLARVMLSNKSRKEYGEKYGKRTGDTA